MASQVIPVLDLFAGPGGLGEGFSAYRSADGVSPFRIALSIEKDEWAHRTLTLRAFYRWFVQNDEPVPPEYYDYLKTPYMTRDRDVLFEQYPVAASGALNEARNITLGKTPVEEVDRQITKALNKNSTWILIGGPPCQAYSLVGRSKIVGSMVNDLLREQDLDGLSDAELEARKDAARKKAELDFSTDKRHTLYREYLRIIAKHAPKVFVMENVRGILSSKRNGDRIFPRILSDLRHPYGVAHEYWPRKRFKNHQYAVYSFVTGSEPAEESGTDFLIRAEEFGVPQARHRVILLGVRQDIAARLGREGPPCLDNLRSYTKSSVRDVLEALPPLRSGISTGGDSLDRWHNILSAVQRADWLQHTDTRVRKRIKSCLSCLLKSDLLREDSTPGTYLGRRDLVRWFADPDLASLPNHETRQHMPPDLGRYLFVAAYGEEHHRSPDLSHFPVDLLPEHRNVNKRNISMTAFADRFRVQIWDAPSSTVTSHLAKDGHYFIHPDPVQCRSLTVREAARLQTFPDNYLFEGPRTEQYTQVGNAVPPLLAVSLAEIVGNVLSRTS
jgi:DNA (cytosine-5)-methyltransferase 1